MLSVLVSDERVFREGSNHGVRLVGIGRLEIIRNRLGRGSFALIVFIFC
jgi:hypothetical protein